MMRHRCSALMRVAHLPANIISGEPLNQGAYELTLAMDWCI